MHSLHGAHSFKDISKWVSMEATVVTDDAARAAFALLTREIALSVPQIKFFRDCESPVLVVTEHGFLAARQAMPKLFSTNAQLCTEIGLVYVKPEKRGNGHGAALLGHLERAASTRLIVVYAQTCIQNPIMAHMYRSAGFQAVFSTLERHAVDALTDPSAWEEIKDSNLDGQRTVVLVKSIL